jgi:hypothetical protein
LKRHAELGVLTAIGICNEGAGKCFDETTRPFNVLIGALDRIEKTGNLVCYNHIRKSSKKFEQAVKQKNKINP